MLAAEVNLREEGGEGSAAQKKRLVLRTRKKGESENVLYYDVSPLQPSRRTSIANAIDSRII